MSALPPPDMNRLLRVKAGREPADRPPRDEEGLRVSSLVVYLPAITLIALGLLLPWLLA